MPNLAGHLVLRSWYAMMAAFNGNTLGFLASLVGIGACIWVAGLLYEWRETRSIFNALYKTKKIVVVEIVGMVIFFCVSIPIFVARTMEFDHNGLKYEILRDNNRISVLNKDIEHRRHYLSNHDPVFINTRDLLSGFSVVRHYLKGEKCSIKVTAPPEAFEMADGFALLSNVTSGCFTEGPMAAFPSDPLVKAKIIDGMVSDAIVIHASHAEDPAINELMMQLVNRVNIIRRYDTATTDYEHPETFKHTIWFQFGDHVKWRSESQETGAQ